MRIDEFLIGKNQHFDMPEIGNDIAISIRTEVEYHCVCSYLTMIGFRWSTENDFHSRMDFWENYRENTLVFPLSGKYGYMLPPGMVAFTYDKLFTKGIKPSIKRIKLLDI